MKLQVDKLTGKQVTSFFPAYLSIMSSHNSDFYLCGKVGVMTLKQPELHSLLCNTGLQIKAKKNFPYLYVYILYIPVCACCWESLTYLYTGKLSAL